MQKNKLLDILGITDINLCLEKLNDINDKIKILSQKLNNSKTENLVAELQLINNELSIILKTYGTHSLEDLLTICFGSNHKLTTDPLLESKLDLLKKYFHPTSYKVVNKKDEYKNKKNTTDIGFDDTLNNIACMDISNTTKQFHFKVYGLKLFVTNTQLKKSLVINGIVDVIILNYLNKNPYFKRLFYY